MAITTISRSFPEGESPKAEVSPKPDPNELASRSSKQRRNIPSGPDLALKPPRGRSKGFNVGTRLHDDLTPGPSGLSVLPTVALRGQTALYASPHVSRPSRTSTVIPVGRSPSASRSAKARELDGMLGTLASSPRRCRRVAAPQRLLVVTGNPWKGMSDVLPRGPPVCHSSQRAAS